MDDGCFDKYDDYSARFQPARSKKHSSSGVSRYEVTRPSLKALQSLRKAKFLFVFPNKKTTQKEETPVRVTFSRKKFPCIQSLLDEISRLTKANGTSVTCLYKWPCGDQVYDITEIEEDEETNKFVWSSGKKLDMQLIHGGIKFGDKNSRCSDKPSRGQQLTIHVISNIDRKSKQSLLIDPFGKQSFEEILKSIEGMVRVNPPCMALVTKSCPYVKVQSISTLKSVIPKYGDTFYACGREGDVREKLDGTPSESPTRNGQRRMKNGVKQNVHHQQRDDRIRQSDSHMRQSDSQYDQYEDDDEQMEDYKQRSASPQRSHNKRNKNHNDNLRSQNRQSRRYDDENDDNEERIDSEQQILGRQRRDSSTSSHREDEQQRSDDDAMDEGKQRDHPSEEEMRKAIDAMDARNTKLDDDINY